MYRMPLGWHRCRGVVFRTRPVSRPVICVPAPPVFERGTPQDNHPSKVLLAAHAMSFKLTMDMCHLLNRRGCSPAFKVYV
jgi:hypothetical protein